MTARRIRGPEACDSVLHADAAEIELAGPVTALHGACSGGSVQTRQAHGVRGFASQCTQYVHRAQDMRTALQVEGLPCQPAGVGGLPRVAE